jgi:large subunit ribosomal protein L24e
MENCSFCGYAITPGTGKMYVKKDARILYFCSRRCEKNMLKLGRNPRTTTFTAEAKKSKKQQMAAAAHAAQHKAEVAAEGTKPEAKAKAAPKKAPAKKAAKTE